MKTLLNATIRQELYHRLEKLSPYVPAIWGTMPAIQMLAHLSLQLECALHIRPVERLPISWLVRPFRKLIINVVSWPHNLPTAQSWKNPKTMEWDDELNRFLGLTEQFSETRHREIKGIHPLFGPLNRKEWGRLSYRHINHHFRQFGI